MSIEDRTEPLEVFEQGLVLRPNPGLDGASCGEAFRLPMLGDVSLPLELGNDAGVVLMNHPRLERQQPALDGHCDQEDENDNHDNRHLDIR